MRQTSPHRIHCAALLFFAAFCSSAAAQSTPNPLQLRPDHATAAVTDLDRAVRWYQDTLGFRVVNRGERPNGSRFADLEIPGYGIGQPPAAPAPATAPQAVVKPVADGVYLFEFAGYQSMFVVDPGGVLITDPISPAAATAYLAEVRKLTSAPIRYVVYSHHHFDHIAGGAPFKQAGAVFVAHRNAKVQLERLKNPAVVPIDRTVDEAVRVADMQGLCPNRAPIEVKLPKYANLFEYEEFLPMNVDRMCLYWRNGWQ
jgi:catechol 2,3-dioxygenase-like lactoylglutathione lyase family enzyme